MINADKFKSLFGIYATELWAMPEKDFLEWLNSEVSNCSEMPNNWIPCTPETMPECGQEVLTRDTYGGIWICSLLFTGRNNEAYWEDNYGYLYNLDEQIAWMPLPESWKGE